MVTFMWTHRTERQL